MTGQPARLSASDRHAATGPRRLAVLSLVAAGRSDQEIADSLALSPEAVESELMSLLGLFDVPDRKALVASARRYQAVPDAEGRDAMLVMRWSLEEVIGATAYGTLLRRAAKHADVPVSATGPPAAELTDDDAHHLIRALWPLLAEFGGQVLTGRLESLGFQAGGDFATGELARWTE